MDVFPFGLELFESGQSAVHHLFRPFGILSLPVGEGDCALNQPLVEIFLITCALEPQIFQNFVRIVERFPVEKPNKL